MHWQFTRLHVYQRVNNAKFQRRQLNVSGTQNRLQASTANSNPLYYCQLNRFTLRIYILLPPVVVHRHFLGVLRWLPAGTSARLVCWHLRKYTFICTRRSSLGFVLVCVNISQWPHCWSQLTKSMAMALPARCQPALLYEPRSCTFHRPCKWYWQFEAALAATSIQFGDQHKSINSFLILITCYTIPIKIFTFTITDRKKCLSQPFR